MKKQLIIIGIIVLLITVGLSGCNEQSGQQRSTIKPSDMVLTLSGLLSDYKITERVERVKSDISEVGLSLGWIKGYYIRFERTGENINDTIVFEQYISIYPIENMSNVLYSGTRISNETIDYDDLSKPNIGDDSLGYRRIIKDDGNEEIAYIIEFIKMDVYEQLAIFGNTTDYELLKDLAKEAVEKIK